MKIPFSLRVMWRFKTVTVQVCEGVLCCIPSSLPFALFVCEGSAVVCMCVCVWQQQQQQHMRGPDMPETSSFGFLVMSFPTQQSKAVLQRFHQTQGKQTAGLGPEGTELSPCRPTDGHKGVRASPTTKGNALPYCQGVEGSSPSCLLLWGCLSEASPKGEHCGH